MLWLLCDAAGVGGGVLLSHGFALRASPAVKHGVSPLGTVGEHAMSLGRVDAIRAWARILMGFSGAISA